MSPPRTFAHYDPVVLPPARNPAAVDNPSVDDVPGMFGAVRTDGDYLRVWDANLFPGMRYTAHVDNTLGVQNHFQGIQRLRKGRYVIISGGDPRDTQHGPVSHLFVVQLGSRNASGPLGANIVRTQVPPAEDRVVRTIGISRDYWHAGGMTLLGDILAVPVESYEPPRSRVVFYDVSDPHRPRQFRHEIKRDEGKAGAVALTRLATGRFLAAVWSDSDAHPRRLDFYLSHSTDFSDGFRNDSVRWVATRVQAGPGQDANFGNFQAVNFVRQSDGALYLVGLHNTSDQAPTVPGRDYADLFAVDLPDGWLESSPSMGVPAITKVAKRQFFCNDQQCNMDAGGGVYVDAEGHLHVYAAWHWRSDNQLRFNEYRHQPDAQAPAITRHVDGWIDLFEHRRYRGRRLSVLGRTGMHFPDYGALNVQGSSFHRVVSSVRYQLPAGSRYTLYEEPRYEGPGLILLGSGHVEELPNLKTWDFEDRTASSRYE